MRLFVREPEPSKKHDKCDQHLPPVLPTPNPIGPGAGQWIDQGVAGADPAADIHGLFVDGGDEAGVDAVADVGLDLLGGGDLIQVVEGARIQRVDGLALGGGGRERLDGGDGLAGVAVVGEEHFQNAVLQGAELGAHLLGELNTLGVVVGGGCRGHEGASVA